MGPIPPGLGAWPSCPPAGPTISSSARGVHLGPETAGRDTKIHHFAFTGSRTVAGDWAFENGVYLLKSSPAAGGEKQGQRGKLIFVWKRGPEGWKGALVSFNMDGYWP